MGIEEMPNIDKKREELDKEHEEIEKKEYITPEDKERLAQIGKEHQELSNKSKNLERGELPPSEAESTEPKLPEPKESESKEPESKEPEPSELKTESKEEIKKTGTKGKGKKKKLAEQPEPKKEKTEKEILDEEITKKYYDELAKIQAMPENTDNFKEQKAKQYFELIDDWLERGHKDNYQGIQTILSDLDNLQAKGWFYNIAKNQEINKIALTMAANYKEWRADDITKIKTIKNIAAKQKQDLWGSPDKTLKKVAEILASQEIPYKGNIDSVVSDIQNPNIKAGAINSILTIEKKSINQKEELLKNMKEEAKEQEVDVKTLENVFSSLDVNKLLDRPEDISQLFSQASEIMKDPEAQKKCQEFIQAIKRATEKGEKSPSAVNKAKEYIQEKSKKETAAKNGSKPIFETAGLAILLFLVLFMLLELKGVDYLTGHTSKDKKK
jgi:hypothetical protein